MKLGASRKSSSKVSVGLRSMASRRTTVTAAGASPIKVGLRVAVTTISSPISAGEERAVGVGANVAVGGAAADSGLGAAGGVA